MIHFYGQLLKEMGRIVGNADIEREAKEKWKTWNPKIIQQAKLESQSNSKLRRVLQSLDLNTEGLYNI